MPAYDTSIPPEKLSGERRGYDPYENAPQRSISRRLFLTALGAGAVAYVGNRILDMDESPPDVPTPGYDGYIPEVATPEIARVNAELAGLQLGQTNSLDALLEAAKVADATFAPHDKDRLPEMPAGYVKFMLPHEATGIIVPYTVSEKTADIERYTSPEMQVTLWAMAKFYQDLKAKYPEITGEMLRVRDLNSLYHDTHKYGRQVDVNGQLGSGITQHSTGSLADKQFSPRFNAGFTIDMAVAMAGLTIGGKPAVQQILYSERSVNGAVNQQVGREFMHYSQFHLDHWHMILATGGLPKWTPSADQYPWSKNQDLRVGGEAEAITEEQHDAQHEDFEDWAEERQHYADQMNTQEGQMAPEGFDPEPLSDAAAKHIDDLDLPDGHKDFLKMMVPGIATVYRAGAKINPVAALAQTSLETGFGDDDLSQNYNNYFGIKVGKNWKDKSVNLNTHEEYTAGKIEQAKDNFRVYPDVTSSVADYARFVQSPTRPWYADAIANYRSYEGYINGLFNEVDGQGNIVREQGTEGVFSYGTDRGYEQKAFDVIRQSKYEDLMRAQLGAAEAL